MSATMVADIVVGATDSTGTIVETVYGKVSATYAVYGTAERVMLQFADDPALSSDQRRALAPLFPVRGQINGLIDGWRASGTAEDAGKARLFDRRVADALVVGLQGYPDYALELLNEIKLNIVEERTSIAKVDYVGVAGLATLVLCVVIALATSNELARAAIGPAGLLPLWQAAAIGAVGALFSIGLQIRERNLKTDLQRRTNRVDAVARILIGATSAVILIALLDTGIVRIGFGDADFVTGPGRTLTTSFVLVVAFAAGFTERLVSGFVSTLFVRAVPAAAESIAGGGGGAPQGKPAAKPGAEVNEQNPLGRVSASAVAPPHGAAAMAGDDAQPAPDDDVDGCPSDTPVPPDEQTEDIELPAAEGGVARP